MKGFVTAGSCSCRSSVGPRVASERFSFNRLDFRDGGGVSAIAYSSTVCSPLTATEFFETTSLYSGLGGGVTAGRASGDVGTTGDRFEAWARSDE